MGIDGGKERQYDGYPFVPQHAERPLFARCVRNAIVERVLDGAQAVYRFGDGRRFKFPIPEGDKLLSHVVHADVIAVQGRRKSIQVTVRFPCVVPHAAWSSDPFEATMRVEYVPEHWELPKHYDEDPRPTQPRDEGIDLTRLDDGDVPGRPSRDGTSDDDRWHGFRDEILAREAAAAENGGGTVWKGIRENRVAIGIVLAAAAVFGWAASEIDVSKSIDSARQEFRKFNDWIDATQHPVTLPPRR